MRADGGSAEHPGAPSHSQLLMLLHHHFTPLLFPTGLENIQKGLVITLNTTLCGGFLSSQSRGRGSGVHSQLHQPDFPISSLWNILRGEGRLHGLHYAPCSFMAKLPSFLSRYNILILLQVLMSSLPETCKKLCSFSIAIPPLLMFSVTLTNLQLLVFILIINKLDKHLSNLSETDVSGKSLKINQRYLKTTIYMFVSTYFTAVHRWALENPTFIYTE